MKKFSEIRAINENLTSGGGQGATYSMSPLGIGNAADEPDYAVWNITDPGAIQKINAFLGAAGSRSVIEPMNIVRQLQRKLAIVGLQFLLPAGKLKSRARVEVPADTKDQDENSWTEVYPLTYLGGRFGVLDNMYNVGRDDGITHRRGHGLKLEITYYNNSDGTVQVRPKIVDSAVNEETVAEDFKAGFKSGRATASSKTKKAVSNYITGKAKKAGRAVDTATTKVGLKVGSVVGKVEGAGKGLKHGVKSSGRAFKQGRTGKSRSELGATRKGKVASAKAKVAVKATAKAEKTSTARINSRIATFKSLRKVAAVNRAKNVSGGSARGGATASASSKPSGTSAIPASDGSGRKNVAVRTPSSAERIVALAKTGNTAVKVSPDSTKPTDKWVGTTARAERQKARKNVAKPSDGVKGLLPAPKKQEEKPTVKATKIPSASKKAVTKPADKAPIASSKPAEAPKSSDRPKVYGSKSSALIALAKAAPSTPSRTGATIAKAGSTLRDAKAAVAKRMATVKK